MVANKADLRADSALRADGAKFYNYLTRILLERIAHAASDWSDGPRLANVRFDSIKGMNHQETVEYLSRMRRRDSAAHRVPWDWVKWPPRWHGTDKYEGLQLADIYAGMLHAALDGDVGDASCGEYLLAHAHQLRRGPGGKVQGYGLKVLWDWEYVRQRAWWTAIGHD